MPCLTKITDKTCWTALQGNVGYRSRSGIMDNYSEYQALVRTPCVVMADCSKGNFGQLFPETKNLVVLSTQWLVDDHKSWTTISEGRVGGIGCLTFLHGSAREGTQVLDNPVLTVPVREYVQHSLLTS